MTENYLAFLHNAQTFGQSWQVLPTGATWIFLLITVGVLLARLRLWMYSRSVERVESKASISGKSSDSNAYLHIFPPSTGSRLGLRPKSPDASSEEQRLEALQRCQMPYDISPEDCDPSMRTPTDVTLNEIKSIGDFPDFAQLTGVPHPAPDPEFDFETALPRPYRPVRWRWVQNMSLMRLETDRWLELTNDYKVMLAWRQELLKQHGEKVLSWQPGTEVAAKEVMEMALQFYCKRYPKHFQLENRPSYGWVFVNRILENETVLRDHHPLKVLFDNVPEEFMLTLRNHKDGLYYLRAGICCSSVNWHMGMKMNQPLATIHGPVPDYAKNMAFSMDRFFAKMPSDRPIQRGSFEIKTGRPLFKEPEEEGAAPWQDPSISIEDITFRVDWQTLRRLPLSGAIVFNFKCLFFPMTEFRDEKYMPALMHKMLTEGQENMLQYKGSWALEHVLLPNLETWAREQEDKGIVERGWEPRTLDESPFFEGWQKKWRQKMANRQSW